MTAFDPQAYWDRRFSSGVDLNTVGYLNLGLGFNASAYRVRRRVFRRAIKSLRLRVGEAPVLDIGSGSGFYVQAWKDLGAKRVTGIDVSTSAVRHLRYRYPDVEFIHGDVSTSEFLPGRQFEVVTALDVLFHIVDDDAYETALRNVYSVLRPGGYFVFSELFLQREFRGTAPPAHQGMRTLAEIESMLRQVGFEIMGRRPMLFFMNTPVDSESRVLRSLWKRLTRLAATEERVGRVVGTAMLPFELLAVRLFKESPSTEMMVCRVPPSVSRET